MEVQESKIYKVCWGCKKSLPIDFFGIDKNKKDGIAHMCKACKNKQMYEYRQRYKRIAVERTRRANNGQPIQL
jgi:hypothetical protein